MATRDLLHISDAADVRDLAVALVGELGGYVVPPDRADGSVVPVDLSFGAGGPLLPCAPANGAALRDLRRFMGPFAQDGVRALSMARSFHRLAEEASIDPLTGLANRRAMGRILGRIEDGDALVLIDLDHFKELNDTRGHDHGDEVLKAFGAMLRSTLRERDHPGRYGGEEFLIVVPDTDVSEAQGVVDRLYEQWAEARPAPISFSAGIAPVGVDADALKAADAALYEAKRRGRGRAVVAFDHDGGPAHGHEAARGFDAD